MNEYSSENESEESASEMGSRETESEECDEDDQPQPVRPQAAGGGRRGNVCLFELLTAVKD